MTRRIGWMAAMAAAIFGFAGAGGVARAAYKEVDTNLFEIVSIETGGNVGGWAQTAGDSGALVRLRAKCNLPGSIPTDVQTDDGGMIYAMLSDSDCVLFRLAVDLGDYPRGGYRTIPTYLRAEECVCLPAGSSNLPDCTLHEDADGVVDPCYTGTYLRLSVGELRTSGGLFDVWWYPTKSIRRTGTATG